MSVRSVRLRDFAGKDGAADNTTHAMPDSADALLAMRPGESVSITGQSKTKLFGGTLMCRLDRELADGAAIAGGGTWLAGGPLAVEVSIDHEGLTTTEVLRGDDTAARLLVTSKDQKMVEASGGIHIGIYLSWALTAAYELGRRLSGGAKTAMEMVSMPVWREHTSGAFAGAGRGSGTQRLAEIRLDLSRPEARTAYEAAMRGDLDVARKMADVSDSGVEMPFSAETEIRRKILPVSLGLFGIGVEWRRSHESHHTVAVVSGERVTRDREIDGRARSVTDFTLHHRGAMMPARDRLDTV